MEWPSSSTIGVVLCGNGEHCDPLTITDAYSRFIMCCQTVPAMSRAHVDAICDAAMREFGMPERIRTDNGTLFATLGALGPSKLSAKWILRGIIHERIEPGCRAIVAVAGRFGQFPRTRHIGRNTGM